MERVMGTRARWRGVHTGPCSGSIRAAGHVWCVCVLDAGDARRRFHERRDDTPLLADEPHVERARDGVQCAAVLVRRGGATALGVAIRRTTHKNDY